MDQQHLPKTGSIKAALRGLKPRILAGLCGTLKPCPSQKPNIENRFCRLLTTFFHQIGFLVPEIVFRVAQDHLFILLVELPAKFSGGTYP